MAFCSHHVYHSDKDAVALSCQLCNPDGTGTGEMPVLPRSSGDPLNSTKTAKAETCENCGCIRTYFSSVCRACGTAFALSDSNSRHQGAANATQSGVCPGCGSNVHYETAKASKWECSDCGEIYAAPKRSK